MLHFARWKIVAIVGVCIAAVVFALPNFFSADTVRSWPDWLPKRQLSLGLDLRGGAHLLYAMDVKELRKNMLSNLRADVRKRLRDAKIGTVGTGIVADGVQTRLGQPADMERALAVLREMAQPIGGGAGIFAGTDERDVKIEQLNDRVIRISLSDAAVQEKITEAISGAIETVRRRVDEFGTSEPNITRQGSDRILVQVPGVQDTQGLKELIGKTAKLSFHEVHPSQGQSTEPEVARGDYRSYPAAPTSDSAGTYFYLKEPAVVRGDQLKSASQSYDQRTNEPIILFTFNQEGARAFARFTSENVNRPFAIVLDNQVLSAPVVREPILGGSGQISGGFTVKDANDLAIQLRSGALPADLTVVEERSVGPSLGADSVASGRLAGIVGAVATVILTIWVYGTFGLFAVIGLILNAMFIVALMSAIGSVLTLPGIAGLVLTIGMAVDANVLIYERIREELRAGKTAIAAIDSGFGRAIVTILDSQLTTLAAAIIMFWLGSGPIRGFAVTLSIGIFTSIFTAVTVVRLMIAIWLQFERRKSRSVDVPI
ncbi:MAG: protein translocase subunit SecD [Hyphomicrobiaceae bacterium]